jgi:hypothetical protein
MCRNKNLKRELSTLTALAKSKGVYKIGRKNGKRTGSPNKVSLKDLINAQDREMPGVNVYQKLITDAHKGRDIRGDGWYTRELFRTMKDLDYGNIKSWHKMFDGYSPQNKQDRDA